MKTINALSIALTIAFGVAATSYTSLTWAHGDEKYESEQTEFGQPGVVKAVSRTIDIEMSDTMRFTPDQLAVTQGETVRLRLHNTGKSAHEFVLGTAEEIAEHAELMRKFPDMKHADASAVRAEPGTNAEIVWQFNRAGDFVFACLIPGHSEAGMRGTVTVTGDAKLMADVPAKKPAMDSNTAGELSEGEIRKVDVANGKLTIRHGELKNLGMPSMTMVFGVKDPAWLQQYKTGDKINFLAEEENGGLIVKQIKIKN